MTLCQKYLCFFFFFLAASMAGKCPDVLSKVSVFFVPTFHWRHLVTAHLQMLHCHPKRWSLAHFTQLSYHPIHCQIKVVLYFSMWMWYDRIVGMLIWYDMIWYVQTGMYPYIIQHYILGTVSSPSIALMSVHVGDIGWLNSLAHDSLEIILWGVSWLFFFSLPN